MHMNNYVPCMCTVCIIISTCICMYYAWSYYYIEPSSGKDDSTYTLNLPESENHTASTIKADTSSTSELCTSAEMYTCIYNDVSQNITTHVYM